MKACEGPSTTTWKLSNLTPSSDRRIQVSSRIMFPKINGSRIVISIRKRFTCIWKIATCHPRSYFKVITATHGAAYTAFNKLVHRLAQQDLRKRTCGCRGQMTFWPLDVLSQLIQPNSLNCMNCIHISYLLHCRPHSSIVHSFNHQSPFEPSIWVYYP